MLPIAARRLTPAQLRALENCAWIPDGVWWHDLPPGTRDVLLREGLIEQKGKHPGCNTREHMRGGRCTHPGYMTATRAGWIVLGWPLSGARVTR